MTIKPLYDRILVKRVAEENVTAGGIVIPDAAQEKPMRGEVIAVGGGKVTEGGQTIALTVKPGDIVMFGKYTGSEIKIDGVEHLVMREEEVFGIIEN